MVNIVSILRSELKKYIEIKSKIFENNNSIIVLIKKPVREVIQNQIYPYCPIWVQPVF